MATECVIGVDLGGTKLLAGAVDDGLQVHHRAHRKSRGQDASEVLDIVADAVAETRDAYDGEISAVGFGIPSLIDRQRGAAVSTVHLPLQDVPFRDLMSERLGLPVTLDNDANAALVAEHRFGAARGADHAVLLTLGTGVGSAIVVDRKLVHGASGAAGEIGHMVIEQDGPPCSGACPNRGCLETLASGTALAREALIAAERYPNSELGRALASGREISGALAVELAHDGDEAAREVVALIGSRLGVGIANVINIFNPEVVVIGGGVIGAGDLLLEAAREVAQERALSPSKEQVQIVPARFGAESGMLGAAVLALDLVARPVA
jgi:glucokinase